MESVISLFVLVVCALTLLGTIFAVFPAIGRARLSREAAEIRDEVDELVITGQLPLDDCIADWLRRAEIVIDDPRILSFTKVLAVHRAHVHLGVPLEASPEREYESLTKPQRRMMYEFDERMIRAITRGLITGSTLSVFLCFGALIMRMNHRIRRHVPAPGPTQLAHEFYGAKDIREFQMA